jgi:hypothetical protein
VDPAELARVQSDNDVVRFALGVISYALALVLFCATAWWAACSIDDMVSASTVIPKQGDKSPPAPVVWSRWLIAAKALLLVTVSGFAVALLRAAERLTMPLVRYLQLEEHRARKGVQPTSADDLLSLAAKLIEVGSKMPRN